MMVKHTICPSCSAGCGVNIIEVDGSPAGTYPYKRHIINEGKTCRRGRECYEIPVKDRITSPAVKKSGNLKGADWDEALDGLTEMISSPETAILTTGTLTDEEAAKLKRIIERVDVKKYGLITVFPEFDYPEIDVRKIRNYDNIAVIGDVMNCAPLLARRMFQAMDGGAEVRSYDRREITRTAMNSSSHLTFSDNLDLLDKLREFPADLIMITAEIPDVIEDVLEASAETGAEVLPVFEDFNTRGVMQHIPPIRDHEEIESLWLIDPGAVAEPLDVKGSFVLQSIKTSGAVPDIFLATAGWCEKEGSYTGATGHTVKLEPALPEPEGVLTDGEIFERILERLGD